MGAVTYQKLAAHFEGHPEQRVFGISLKGVEKIEYSFASESLVEIVRRYRGKKAIFLTDVTDAAIIENIDAAAARVGQPIILRKGKEATLLGQQPSRGNRDAFDYAMSRASVRAAEFAETVAGMSIANASTKFKQLWEQGFLMRSESAAESGGVEFIYERIG